MGERSILILCPFPLKYSRALPSTIDPNAPNAKFFFSSSASPMECLGHSMGLVDFHTLSHLLGYC